MNKGERAELKFIATLSCLRGENVTTLQEIDLIRSIKSPTSTSLIEVRDTHPDLTPEVIKGFSDRELEDFCKASNIHKAGPFSKSDVYVNDIGFSLKFTGSAPPAIVNHTSRVGWSNVAEIKQVDIDELDQIIDDYWNKRIASTIREDIPNSDPNSPFAAHIDTLLPYLEYFSFEGTGSRRSDHPASYVIEFSDPCDFNSWKFYNKQDYIRKTWPNLVFSIRSKRGMPSDINRVSDEEKASILKWSRLHQGALRGALHIRVLKERTRR
jgi:hypothetical protein